MERYIKMDDVLNCICMRNRRVCNCNRPNKIEKTENRECLCGRSPNNRCMSWHALPEKVYLQRKNEYEISLT